MSEFVLTRTSVQCRSQNQRLFRKHKNFRNIITAFKAEYGKERFESNYQELTRDPKIKFKTELESLMENMCKKTAEMGIQTDEPLMPQPLRRQSAFMETQCTWPLHSWNSMPNVMVFPFFS
jgi:anti-sigma-K factor RskA